MSSPSTFQPSHQPSHSHSSSSSLLPANTPSPYANAANQTRILLLSDFDPALKTRDLMDLLSEWEDDRGGFKVKWKDDTSAFIVFMDAHVAKRAFLSLLTNPPKRLMGSSSEPLTKLHPNVTAYTGSDVQQILQAVQNRPRSHSNAGMMQSHHSRKGSQSGSTITATSNSTTGGGGGGGGGSTATHHSRTASWGRNSLDRRAAKDLIDPSSAFGGSGMTASGLPSSNPFSTATAGEGARASSPESFSQGHGGIVAGEPPRRIGQSSNGFHRRSGSESTSSSSNRVAGSTIRE